MTFLDIGAVLLFFLHRTVRLQRELDLSLARSLCSSR